MGNDTSPSMSAQAERREGEEKTSASHALLPDAGGCTFSIVVPTFRRVDYLSPLFQSVAADVAGSAGSVELVLVDNSPEASAANAAAKAPAFVRYVHEPRTGVAQARNRGVAEARGNHVIFLDDDERPVAGWFAAFAAAAAQGEAAAFGSIEPDFSVPPTPALQQPLSRVFSRELPCTQGEDVRAWRAHLGSGNSMFRKDVLGLVNPPFDTAFDAGGEDVWLFRKLVDTHGVILTWCPAARVQELVPASRSNIDFLRQRRFSDGQLRVLVESGAGGARGALRVALWMGVGLAQCGLYGLAALVSYPVSRPHSTRFQLAAIGGAGKLLWWRRKLKQHGAANA